MDERLKRAIRRSFERAAASYDAAAFLQHEVARRLDEHLEEMKIRPGRILDAGCGTGYAQTLLRARYPEAEFLGLDLAQPMLHRARARHAASLGLMGRLRASLWSGAPRCHWLCGDLERLPLARASLDLAWSSLALQWVEDLDGAFREMRRVLRPDGLFIFASFGPDTLMELRAASAGLDGHQHVNRFVDMHDVGDALVRAGFANPVMEMERITLTYADLRDLLNDLKAIGAHTVMHERRAGLMGKAQWRRLAEGYEAFRHDGRLPATYEVVYGHAWAGAHAPRADGRQVIEFHGRPA